MSKDPVRIYKISGQLIARGFSFALFVVYVGWLVEGERVFENSPPFALGGTNVSAIVDAGIG